MTAAVRERFTAAQAIAPDLRTALETLARQHDEPGEVAPASVGAACHRIYQWFDLRGMARPAAAFAEAAAYADPRNCTLAVDAGWICRKVGGTEMLNRSGEWYVRAYQLSVRAKHREDVLRALTGYGALMKDLGEYDLARGAYEESARRAHRTGRTRRAAVAYHYLFALAAETGQVSEAVAWADKAVTHDPRGDDRIPFLLHDFAYLLVRRGCYATALRLLERAAAAMLYPHEMGLMFGTAAEAAGGARRRERYAAAEAAALNLIATDKEHAPAALESLALGAWSLHDWPRAEQYAAMAFHAACERGDVPIQQTTERLIARLAHREKPPHAVFLSTSDPAARLAWRLAARMRVWRRPKRRRRVDPGIELYL